MNLRHFLSTHRDEIISRAQTKVASRTAPLATTYELAHGVPLFLDQLGDILRQEHSDFPVDGSEMGKTATRHGNELLQHGFSIAQVVHDYGDVCQAVTELAMDLEQPIGTDEFHTLNRCLDNAIASAVTEYSRQREVGSADAELRRQGFFAHELRNHLNTATLAFNAVRTGRVGVSGSTVRVLERSLRGLRDLIDRSVSEVRLASGLQHMERLRVVDFIEETEIDASIEAENRGLRLSVESVDSKVFVNADRHLLASALSNLLQNAFKFTRPSGHVWLRTRATKDRVSIEVADECGGLPPGGAEKIFLPFERAGADRAGLGLGLTISRQAIEANGGTLSVRDVPGTGCVFTVEMPRATEELPQSSVPEPVPLVSS